MIKINQTVVDKEIGNCMQAVLASLFEKELEETINVINYPEDTWFTHFYQWIESAGYVYDGVMNPAKNKEESYEDLKNINNVLGYLYAVVPSKTFDGASHAVIIDTNGIVVHDPNPNKAWEGIDVVSSGDICYWYLFSRIKA